MITLKQTLAAIKEEIDMWDKISKGQMVDKGYDTSSLCKLYDPKKDYFCEDCPVGKKSGENFCHGTPYDNYIKLETSQNAKKFRDWLKDLYIEVCEKG